MRQPVFLCTQIELRKMNAETNLIIETVDYAIRMLLRTFTANPTLFFTEHDIVCWFYRILADELQKKELLTVPDSSGCVHSLIHTEYPTPFRCYMGDHSFRVVPDEDRGSRGPHSRGHYDFVILSPCFVRRHNYSEIKGQNFAGFKRIATSACSSDNPLVLYAIEFAFSRDEIKLSRGKDREQGAHRFCRSVLQDLEKLKAGLKFTGFMHKAASLAFLHGTSNPDVIGAIRMRLEPHKLVTLVRQENSSST